MPERCVVAGCSNTRNLDEGISLHTIPFYGDERPEAKKRRKNWVSFVKQKRAKWEPTRHSVICSKHFKDTDFSQRFSEVEGLRMQGKRCLNSDELGVSVFPSVYIEVTENPLTDRAKRQVNYEIYICEVVLLLFLACVKVNFYCIFS